MNWLAFVQAVLNIIVNDPALKPLEAEVWAWILSRLAPHQAGVPAKVHDPVAIVAEFKTSKGI